MIHKIKLEVKEKLMNQFLIQPVDVMFGCQSHACYKGISLVLLCMSYKMKVQALNILAIKTEKD